jgi:hypothetical protein
MFDAFGALSVVVVFVLCAKLFVGFSFKFDGSPYYRVSAIAVSCIPSIFLYVLCRVVLTPISSAGFSGISIIALSYANHMKHSTTGEPLSWTDISTTANLSIIIHYLSAPVIAVALFCSLAAGYLFLRYELPAAIGRFKAYRTVYAAGVCIFLAIPIALHGRLTTDAISHAAVSVFEAVGAKYDSFEWSKNIRKNGLGIHLIQTSLRHMPPDPTEEETRQFERLAALSLPRIDRPKTVVMVLCESCWHDDIHFRDVFEPLVMRGFVPFRSVAPGYGGGTVNSAFEMLTGLPARGNALTGVIYQEYSSVMSDSTYSLPRYLADDGYRTVAMHNNLGRFWKRDIVTPKMGFQEFHDIDDMGAAYTGEWADDSLLFEAALRRLKSNAGKPIFMHLTTVYTHAGYERRGDFGESHYREKLADSIADMARFVDDVQRLDPAALVLVYGDHKPPLTSYFVSEGVLPKAAFAKTGELDTDYLFGDAADPLVVGDMPVWIRGPEPEALKKFVSTAGRHPLFCIANYFNDAFLAVPVPAFSFGKVICDGFKLQGYERTVSRFPSWLYAKSVLK